MLAAVISSDIVAQYEAPFRAAGFHPGLVTISSLCSFQSHRAGAGEPAGEAQRANSLGAGAGRNRKAGALHRNGSRQADEIESVLHPTIAYVEDELKTRPQRIWLAGFGADFADPPRWQAEWGVPWSRSVLASARPGKTTRDCSDIWNR